MNDSSAKQTHYACSSSTPLFRSTPRCRRASNGIIGLIVFVTTPLITLGAEPKQGSSLSREFHDHVAYLASDELEGRGTGARGNELAAEYIAKQFKQAGLEPAGDNHTFFQEFEVTLSQRLTGRPSLTISGAPGLGVLYTNFIPLPFSSADPFDARVAFAGYGITSEDVHYDDYASFDAKRKALIILRYEPHDADPKAKFGGESPSPAASFQAKARTARQHGAAALLIVNPPLHHGDRDRLFSFNDVEEKQGFGIPMMHISRELAAGMLRAARAPDLETLQNELDKTRRPKSFNLRGIRARGTPGLVREKAKSRNVIGLVCGSGPLADEYIAIGAHYDHLGIAIPRGPHPASAPQSLKPEIHNGADDNASGDAGLILLAEEFGNGTRSAHVSPKPGEDGSKGFVHAVREDQNDPSADKSSRRRRIDEKISGNKRSLLFIAFSGEEMGLLGSMYFVQHPTVPLDRIVAMLNMDMIGRLRNNRLEVFGTKTSPLFEDLVKNYANKFGFKLQTSGGGFGPSDHTSFYTRQIPVLHFFTGIHEDYHRPSDKIDKIDAEGGARIVQMIAAIAADLREMPTPPQYVAIPEPRGSRAGLKVRLGLMPSYAEDEHAGLQLDGVSPGSPAEKGGLKGGDRLLMLGNTPVNNVYDLMDAMGKYEPGNEANAIVLRGGQRVQLGVKFEAP